VSSGVSENLRLYLRMEADLAALEIGGETVNDEVRAEVASAWERLSDNERRALEKRSGRAAAPSAKALPVGSPIVHARADLRGMKVKTLCGDCDEGEAPVEKYNAKAQRMDIVEKGRPADQIVEAFSIQGREQVTCIGCRKVLKKRDDELLASWARRKA